MYFVALASTLLFASSLTLTFADAAAGTEIANRAEPGKQTLSYGTNKAQSLDFWRASNTRGPAPLVLFVHGGGWTRGSKDNATGRDKAPHYTREGYNFASINYRLVPEATVEQEAQDVANALASLVKRAEALGIDRHRIVLMGHSAGAHLVALVGTDPQYLRAAGLSESDIAGIVPIDGAAYDVAAQMQASGGRWMRNMYGDAFGTDPARQRSLSPTLQAGAPNAPSFLILHVQRPDGIAQSEALAAALRKAGTPVAIEGFPGTGLQGHMTINRRLGDPNYAATPVVDGWLKRVFA
ncbi:MAG: alpha/beta hydrolase [Candidatus Andeanibacterium colombiense]|uniref:Alpha/beta hydrolase n=1 Tax=Candidatus Andeanibacterium colombiense TaxID=3121345 RepID=A0AAJ5X9Q5_9SPHN|nr:MAG: alpha/beta hydrolase [Sphingomonadaceae bacterium]